jgi:hypothetical protein
MRTRFAEFAADGKLGTPLSEKRAEISIATQAD